MNITTKQLIKQKNECPGCISGDSGEAKCIFCRKCVLSAYEIFVNIVEERSNNGA